MNETDIKKCIKNGYAWSSCGDKPEKTPTKDYTRSQLKTFDGLHATKHSAQLAIATRREDEPANNHAEVKCDMPETLMLSGKLYKRLAEGEPREIGDVPVDGSQTNRFGSVYYRPIAETPEQREDERVAKRKSEGAAKPKTIHEWLLTLPDGYRELALKNEDKAFWPHSEKIENLSDAINFGFGWEKSSEGVDFWEKVYIWAENPSENKLPPLPLPKEHEETPEQRDARINALVDGYIAKGGPITKEQLTDEVVAWLIKNECRYYASEITVSNGVTGYGDIYAYFFSDHVAANDLRPGYWNKADAEHTKWLADKQSQMTPITPEQGKLLRIGDSVSAILVDTGSVLPYDNAKVQTCVLKTQEQLDMARTRMVVYFTAAAAQAVLDKRQAAKQEAKPEMKPTVTPMEPHECSSSSEMNEETITPTESNTTFGNKYHRTIKGVAEGSAVVDVYCVLEAFNVTCPARQHAIKKLLCAGLRGKGDSIQDLSEAMGSVSRAIVLEKQRALLDGVEHHELPKAESETNHD